VLKQRPHVNKHKKVKYKFTS